MSRGVPLALALDVPRRALSSVLSSGRNEPWGSGPFGMRSAGGHLTPSTGAGTVWRRGWFRTSEFITEFRQRCKRGRADRRWRRVSSPGMTF